MTDRTVPREALVITRDDLNQALQLEFPEPTTENVWAHLEALAARQDEPSPGLRGRIEALPELTLGMKGGVSRAAVLAELDR